MIAIFVLGLLKRNVMLDGCTQVFFFFSIVADLEMVAETIVMEDEKLVGGSEILHFKCLFN